MKKILLASRSQFSGKSAIAIGLGLTLAEEGHKIGYFKPIGRKFQFGDGKELDHDALVVTQALKLSEAPEDLCPVLLDRDFVLKDIDDGKRKEILDKIKTAFDKVSQGKDIMILEGQRRNYDLTSIGLSNPIVAKQLDVKGLLFTSGQSFNLIDDIFLSKEHFKKDEADLSGVILNNVANYAVPLIKNDFAPVIKKRADLDVIGVIPWDTKLISPMVKEVFQRLGGNVLEKGSEESQIRLCENVFVGAMAPDAALKFFRRTNNNLVITGGDRPDLIVAALEIPNTSCIVLTGNLMPRNRILAVAREKKIPVVLIPHDTHSASGLVRNTTGYVSAENQEKLNHAKKTVKKNVDIKKLLDIF